jgi:hypothetical protein
VCYVVNRDPHLQHSFSTQIEHTSHGHSFGLDYTLSFAVINPRKTVERINDDPVRKLEHTIKGTIDAEARKIEWKRLSQNVLDSAGEGLTKEILDHQLAGLKEFAEKYGIEVQSVGLIWHLGADEVAHIQAEVKGEKNKRLATINADTAKKELTSQHEIDVLKAQQEAEISAIRRKEQLYDIALQKTEVALGNVAEKVNTPEGLRHVYEVVRDTALDRGRQSGLPAYKVGELGAGDAEATSPEIGRVIFEALSQCQSLTLSSSDKRQLLSSVLHFIAECYLLSSGDQKKAEDYKKKADEIVSRASRPLLPDQWSYFRTLNVDALKNQLQ